MHKKNSKINCYAKILILFSIIVLVYGLILDISNDKKLIDPINGVVKFKEEKNTISVTTVDDTNDLSDDSKYYPSNNLDKSNEDSNLKSITSKDNINSNKDIELDTVNDKLKSEIERDYGITIKYGKDTYDYKVGGYNTTVVDDSSIINLALNKLKSSLELYPEGFFKEIKKGGIPLSILLINEYSDKSITGITDSSDTYANISIALSYPFEESFYHESYHYIERYIFKVGGNYKTWNLLNPKDFSYGTIVNNYSYANTFMSDAAFVNNYAQNSDTEDRASTFEYMMAGSKASCLNNGEIVWQKASLIKNTIEAVFKTVDNETVEYWERFL